MRAGSVSSCSTGVPSSGRIGQVGQDDLRKWQNATKTALPLFNEGWLLKAVSPSLKLVYATLLAGDPNGIRTRVTAVKGRYCLIISH